MPNHVDTVRFRLAVAEIGYEYNASDMPGGPQAGPQQNEAEQGRCAADVLSGLATVNNALSAAGFAATAVATAANAPVAVANAIAGAAGIIAAGNQAFEASPACQALDNAGMANSLGIGAMVAP